MWMFIIIIVRNERDVKNINFDYYTKKLLEQMMYPDISDKTC